MTIGSLHRRLQSALTIPPAWRGVREPLLRLAELFARRFAGSQDRSIRVAFVPGRIEVLGRHTDYAGGRSLVCAIDRGFLCLAAANRRGRVRMVQDSREFPGAEFPFDSSIRPRRGHWTNYPITMAQRICRDFGTSAQWSGADVAFASTLPVGSGMSGSSALMMMTFLALAEANGLHRSPRFRREIRDGTDLAAYLACCENGRSFGGLPGGRGVGTSGGSEDHAAILCGRRGRLSLFAFAPMSLEAEIPWPASHVLAIAFSGVRAEKTRAARSRYNLAARRAREAATECSRSWGIKLRTLRDVVDRATVEHGSRGLRAIERALSGADPGLDLPCRVRQFAREDCALIPAAVASLRRGDMAGFGRALTSSHEGSRRWLGNIVPPVHDLVRQALRLGARGASGFGAGFGGSVLAVVPTEDAASFLEQWRSSYEVSHPAEARRAEFFLALPSAGIRIWDGSWSGRYVDRAFAGCHRLRP